MFLPYWGEVSVPHGPFGADGNFIEVNFMLLGSLMAVLSAAAFGLNGATVRRGVLTATVAQGMAITVPIGVGVFSKRRLPPVTFDQPHAHATCFHTPKTVSTMFDKYSKPLRSLAPQRKRIHRNCAP